MPTRCWRRRLAEQAFLTVPGKNLALTVRVEVERNQVFVKLKFYWWVFFVLLPSAKNHVRSAWLSLAD